MGEEVTDSTGETLEHTDHVAARVRVSSVICEILSKVLSQEGSRFVF